MNKKVLLAVAVLTCMTIAGCGKSKEDPEVIELAPGITVVATGDQGAMILDPGTADPFGAVDFENPMVDNTAEDPLSVVESVADLFNVDLADNQYIITANEKEAIVLTALEGYTFETRFSHNNAYLVNEDHSVSYLIYDCTGTLTRETLSEMKDVEDVGDGCFIQKSEFIKAYCFKDDVSMAFVYTNEKGVDVDKVIADIKTLVAGSEICR